MRDEDNRFWLGVNFMFMTAFCSAIFMMSSCEKADRQLQSKERITCMQKGGDWLPYKDAGGQGCVFKKN